MYLEIHAIRSTVNRAVGYIVQEKKTRDGELVDNCLNSEVTAELWKQIRENRNSDNGVLAYHVTMSFDPQKKVTPEEALKVATEYADNNFNSKGFDSVVSTHVDTEIVHSHIVFNSVSSQTGKKFVDDFKTLYQLRSSCLDICRANGIDEHYGNEKNKGLDVSYEKTSAYRKWRDKVFNNRAAIRKAINETITISKSFDDFLEKMNQLGYEVKYKSPKGNELKYIAFKAPFGDTFIRDRTLGSRFSKIVIESRIEQSNKARKTHVKKSYRSKNKNIYKRKSRSVMLGYSYIYKNPLGKYKAKRIRGYLQNVINLYNRSKMMIENPQKYNYVQKKVMQDINDTLKAIKFIRDNNISSVSDIKKIHNDYIYQRNEVDRIFEELNKKCSQLETLINAADAVSDNSAIYEHYQILYGKEKENFYNENKQEIEKYALSNRLLEQKNYSIEKIEIAKKTISELNRQAVELSEQRNQLQQKIDEAIKFDNYAKSLEITNLSKEKSL